MRYHNITIKFHLCANCIAGKETYKKELRKDLDDLKSNLEKLIGKREDVMRAIEKAEMEPQVRRTKDVENWLSKVQSVKTAVDHELRKQDSGEIKKQDSGEIKKQVSGEINLEVSGDIGKFERHRKRSKNQKSSELGKKIEGLLKNVKTLQEEGDFKELTEKIIPKDKADSTEFIEEPTVLVGMSRLDQIWKCMHEKDVGIVGIYGIDGVGKTTLLKQVQNKLLDTRNDYHLVIWVRSLSDQEPQIERIQEQIVKEIGLFDKTREIKNSGEEEIRRSFDETQETCKVFNILSQNKFVLLLDDVRETIDLEKVGVPFPPNPESGSKIVFTTRSLEVCSLMGADAPFKVDYLPEAEAWKLFRSMVGDEALDRPTKVRDAAEAIVRECCGLPLALVTVGHAIASKEATEELENKLQGLLGWTSSFSGLSDDLKRNVFSTLKSSYDGLENDMFKRCAAYCSLFPRKIHRRDLIDLWIGEGFLVEGVKAQNQGNNIIDVLLHACLLEEEEEEEVDCVKIHGLVREMILWITTEFEKEEGNFFIRTDAESNDALEIEKWKDATRVSVMKDYINNLSKCPRCPRLETLFLKSNQLKKIDNFFQFMPLLKVLNLSDNSSLIQLPSEISKLIYLQHLDLSRTGIEQLPEVLMHLVNLKCLNLEHTNQLRRIPEQMISNFSKLYVLRLLKCGSPNQAEDSILRNNGEYLMVELLCLKHLNMLSIDLKSFQALRKYLSSHKLQLCTQSLELQSLEHPKSLKVELSYLIHLKTLCISECEDLEELKIDFGGDVQNIRESRSFPFLEEVIVKNCSKLQDLTWLILAPNLKRLTITDCSHLEEVINVDKLSEFPEMMANLVPFSKLKFLKLHNLENLRSIYWNEYFAFPDFTKKEIEGCKILDKPKESVDEETKKASLDPFSSSSSSRKSTTGMDDTY